MRKGTKHLFRGPEFKLEALSYYYSHGKNAQKTREKFLLHDSTLRTWIKNTPIDEKCVSLHPELMKTIMKEESKGAIIWALNGHGFGLVLAVVTKTSSRFQDFVTHFVTPPSPMNKGIVAMRDVVTLFWS